MKRGALVFAIALAVSACAPKNYVVLLDNPGGGSGKVIVSNRKGRQILDKSGTATAIDRSSEAPSSPWQLAPEKIEKDFSKAFGARPSRFVKFTIYFKEGRTDIDPSSQSQYREMLAEVRRRPGADATVEGHTDRKDSMTHNETLARVRADKIRDALVAAGVPSERIDLFSYGETRPAVPTADDVAELRNRRVEVTLR